MGQGQAGEDACHGCTHHGLGCPVRAAGPAGHSSGHGAGPPSGAGRARPGPADPGAALVSPQLIHAALALLPPGQSAVVALATTRLGPWEVWLAGIVVAGRTAPIGWAVIPYPWPKGRFRTTTVALIRRLQAAFPPEVPWTLVADRGFPSAFLFAHLRHGDTSFSVRLRLSDWVTVGRVYTT